MKIVIFLVSLGFVSCINEGSDDGLDVGFYQPINFPNPTLDMEDNPITEEGFALGRKLFYDTRLSSGNAISCGECHNQSHAFTHHGHDLSEGVLLGSFGARNSQPIQNLAFLNDFTWDGAVNLLWRQPVIPITEEIEMNETLSNVVEKLKADKEYVKMFKTVFPLNENEAINSVNMLKALSQFMGAMISSNSKYDKYTRGEQGVDFTQEEKNGMVLFQQKCASCHEGALFTNQDFINNGIGVNPKLPNELGRSRITISNPDLTIEEGKAHPDYYKFRVPSLRNVEKTFPYMHDGRFVQLKKVLDFYDNDTSPFVQKMESLDGRLIKDVEGEEQLGIPMTETEKEAIVAFLKTLTDNEFLNDERFQKQ